MSTCQVILGRQTTRERYPKHPNSWGKRWGRLNTFFVEYLSLVPENVAGSDDR